MDEYQEGNCSKHGLVELVYYNGAWRCAVCGVKCQPIEEEPVRKGKKK
jgi:hypothetical protein